MRCQSRCSVKQQISQSTNLYPANQTFPTCNQSITHTNRNYLRHNLDSSFHCQSRSNALNTTHNETKPKFKLQTNALKNQNCCHEKSKHTHTKKMCDQVDSNSCTISTFCQQIVQTTQQISTQYRRSNQNTSARPFKPFKPFKKF